MVHTLKARLNKLLIIIIILQIIIIQIIIIIIIIILIIIITWMIMKIINVNNNDKNWLRESIGFSLRN